MSTAPEPRRSTSAPTQDNDFIIGELNRAIDRSIATEEIVAALERYGIAKSTLSERLQDDRQLLTDEARAAFEPAREAQEDVERVQAAVERVGGPFKGALMILIVVTTLAVAGVLIQSLVAAALGSRSLPKILADDTSTTASIGILIGLTVLWLGSASLSTLREARAAQVLGVPAHEAEAEAALNAARSDLVDAVVLPRTREIVEGLGRAPFSRRLGIARAPGLSQVFSSDYEVPTAAMVELRATMAAMNGGSIGLAGARGVGKSVLLQSFVGGHQHLDSRPETIGVVVNAPVQYHTREFILHLFEQVCRQVGGEENRSIAGPRSLAEALLPRSWISASGRAVDRRAPVERLADDHLDIILFERTLTMGGDVAVDAKFAKLSGDVKAQLARVPWSLPQLITTFRNFLATLGREHVVVIGIDELDKLESGADARGFVNELKAIFGVANCFYLVSISEDAMSSFERRGQPVRDVFDSAFDHVLRVPPLEYVECERLLRRRVIGMGAPFVAVCTAVSGGVPRDIIRFARQLMLAAGAHGDELSTLLPAVLAAELKAKTRASLIVAARHSDVAASADTVRWLRELEAGKSLSAALQDLSAILPGLQAIERDDQTGITARRELQALVAETGAWLHHADTVAELFGADYGEARHRELVANGTIDQLAAARHALALGAQASWDATGVPPLSWTPDGWAICPVGKDVCRCPRPRRIRRSSSVRPCSCSGPAAGRSRSLPTSSGARRSRFATGVVRSTSMRARPKA